jgi:hypothetical protein
MARVAEAKQLPMKLEEISHDDWLVGGLAALLALDLLFLPWNHISVSSGAQSVSLTSTATGSPEGWLGTLALVGVLALGADLLLGWLSPHTELPTIGDSRARTRLMLVEIATGLLAFKLLLHLGSAGGSGFWIAMALCAALLYAGRRTQTLEPASR